MIPTHVAQLFGTPPKPHMTDWDEAVKSLARGPIDVVPVKMSVDLCGLECNCPSQLDVLSAIRVYGPRDTYEARIYLGSLLLTTITLEKGSTVPLDCPLLPSESAYMNIKFVFDKAPVRVNLIGWVCSEQVRMDARRLLPMGDDRTVYQPESGMYAPVSREWMKQTTTIPKQKWAWMGK